MRIAFITESFPKLSETFILGKVVMLAQLGHEVTVFTQFRRPPVHSDLLGRINLDRNVVHLPVWDRVRFRDVTRAIAGAGPHPLRMAGVAGAALSGPGARMLALVKSLPFVRQRFDLIHAHYAYMGLRYLDVWDSEASWNRFVEERLHPVVHGLLSTIFGDALPPEPEQIPVSVVHVWKGQSV